MKARLLKLNKDTKLLFEDGTITKASPSIIKDFFINYDKAELLTGTDGKWTDTCLDMTEYPGETLAYLADTGHLVIIAHEVLKQSFATYQADLNVSKYLTVSEYAKKHNRSVEMVKAFIRDGRIYGAFMHGRSYFIPEDAPYPVDEVSRKPTSGNRKNNSRHNK